MSQVKTIPFQELRDYQGIIPGSGMFFGASMTNSSITITYVGPLDRWFCFGFGTAMYNTDVLMYSNGRIGAIHPLGWHDYYNTSIAITSVNQDVLQNWNIVSTGSISPAQRSVTATRALNTGDANDVALNFSDVALNLVWARGATPDYTIAYHGATNKAHGIYLPWLSQPAASFVTDASTVCAGAPMSYSNTSTGGLTSYTWSFPGGNPSISTATNPVVVYASPGIYGVVLTTSNIIGTASVSLNNYIQVLPNVTPAVSIFQTGANNPICAGTLANFTANVTNAGAAPNYQWKINGVNAGVNSAFFTSAFFANPSLINCSVTANGICANPVTVLSPAITVSVLASPFVAITAIPNICISDAPVLLSQGSPPNGIYFVNGTPTGIFNPAQAGIGPSQIIYSYTNAANCISSASVTVFVDACVTLNKKSQSEFEPAIFPNPSPGVIEVFVPNDQIKQLRVFDFSGKLLQRYEFNDETQVKISLPEEMNGLFMLEICLNQRVFWKKIIKLSEAP